MKSNKPTINNKSRYQQGYFNPINPEKYRGDPTEIIYRSSWELKLLCELDTRPDIVSYSCEEIVIPYVCPLTDKKKKKIRRYYMDFLVEYIDANGQTRTMMIEVKPFNQTIQPKLKDNTKRSKARFLKESATWAINKAKWEAAEIYAAKKGWEFEIFSEKQLGIKK